MEGLKRRVEKKPSLIVYRTETVVETEVVEKEVRVIPKYYTVKKGTDIAKSSMGFDFRSEVVERPGRLTTEERATPGSFEANYTLSVNKPVASSTFEEVVGVNEHLPKILPGLEKMMARRCWSWCTLIRNRRFSFCRVIWMLFQMAQMETACQRCQMRS